MLKKSKIVLIVAIALILGLTIGCSKRIEHVYVGPECQAPPLVSEAELPDIDVDYVYDRLGDEVAEDLRKRERLIIDNLLEHRAIVLEVCDDRRNSAGAKEYD